MMASSPEAFGDGEGLVGQGLAGLERAAVGEFRTQGGEHEGPVGMVGGEPVEGHLQDLDLVGVDDSAAAEDQPRSLARAAATRRSVSSRSAARRATRRGGCSRKAGSPVWRWAVPSPMARSRPRTGSGSLSLG